ncbi:polysaccharide biosynthesis protein [Paraliobacillus quinghaiensis]|uniref:Polysaccharide biosynthesis protein n=1 Tax=Paraliobacillus quinghaiensis TaxID=470815 RepID=A0A917TPG2_9BACI|nr:flippase [Paraliobacillus quinghaiensis]GGM31897.1 polysaccharide biosynthesis protein [Paraliobacillus quinghaiensis]
MFKVFLKSSLLKASGIYTITNIINKAIPFLLLPILTVYLTPSDYGVVSMFTVLIGFFMPIAGLNISGAISRKFFDDNKDFGLYISSALYLLFISITIFSIIIFLFSDIIQGITLFPKSYMHLIILCILGNIIFQITLSLWQVREKAVLYGIFQIVLTTLNIIISLILVIRFDYGWLGRINGQVIAFGICSLIGLFIIIKNEKIPLKKNHLYIKDILHFGIPLIPHAVGAFFITMSDRIFITNMVGIHETGIYTVGYQIGMIIQVLQDSFNRAWIPYLYKNLKQNRLNLKVKIVKITYIYFIVILVITLLLSLFSPLITEWFLSDTFAGASEFVIWVALGYAFNGMYKMVGGVIFYEKKTKLLSLVTFITAMLNLVLNYVLIKLNGAVGAAQATTLSFFVSFILTWILASKVHFMPWNLFKYR